MNVNKSALIIISAITFLSPISAFSHRLVSKAELDAAVQQLQAQIANSDTNILTLKSEIGVILKNLQEQINEQAKNQSHAQAETEALINGLQDQITAIKKTQSRTYSIGEKALGGTVILVAQDGQHGLVMADADILQGYDGMTLFDARNRVSDPANYVGSMAQNYYDWRLPTTKEMLDECNRNPQAFAGRVYWTNDVMGFMYMQMSDHYPELKVNFVSATGAQCQANASRYKISGTQNVYVRPVRSF